MKGRLLMRKGQGVKRSRAQEDALVAELGGVRQPGSGNQWHSKGDVKTRDFLVEAKTTSSVSYKLDLAVLRRTQAQAQAEGKLPVVQVQFECGVAKFQWAVIPWELFRQMMQQMTIGGERG